MSENPALEGRPNLAQRLSAGKSRRDDSSPGGTTEFSVHTLKGLGLALFRFADAPGFHQSVQLGTLLLE